MPDNMIRVLCTPTEYRANTGAYARTYRLLRELKAKDVEIIAYAGRVNFPREDLPNNAAIQSLSTDSRIGYRAAAFKTAVMTAKDYDVYHHTNFGFREWNPLVLSSRSRNIPTLLGPVEAGHLVPPAERRRVVSQNLPKALPSPLKHAVSALISPALTRTVNPLRESLFMKTVQNADRIVAVHSDAKDVYANYTDPDKIDIIPYGVNMGKFPYSEQIGGKEFVTVGNLIKRKGHQYLFKAMSDITTKHPKTHLHIVGTGPRRSELEIHARNLGIQDSVTFHGFVDHNQLIELLHRARAFVHPSLSEGFSHVRLEAMSTGCPVIGTDVAGANDLTRDGTDGRIVPTESKKALADAMSTILSDDDLTRQMGRNARNKIERDHDYENIGERYIEIYRDLSQNY